MFYESVKNADTLKFDRRVLQSWTRWNAIELFDNISAISSSQRIFVTQQVKKMDKRFLTHHEADLHVHKTSLVSCLHSDAC